jgi:hypothetical protein
MRNLINAVCRLFGCKRPVVDKDNVQAMRFGQNACQYYVAARFAVYAQQLPVCGNLFHHAIEMALKGGLATKRQLVEVEAMGHRLRQIWRAFKTEFPDPSLNLARHDKTVSGLNKFEDLRYPGTKGAGIGANWSGPPVAPVRASGGPSTPRQYMLIVSDIDELFADIFRAVSWNPKFFFGTANNAARDAIRRENNQSEYLTGQPSFPYQPPSSQQP